MRRSFGELVLESLFWRAFSADNIYILFVQHIKKKNSHEENGQLANYNISGHLFWVDNGLIQLPS